MDESPPTPPEQPSTPASGPTPPPGEMPPPIETAAVAPEPPARRFDPAVTILCTVVVLLATAWLYVSDAMFGREAKLDNPERDLHQVMGRQLDADELAERMSRVEKFLNTLRGDQPGTTLTEAIEAYTSYLSRFTSPDCTRTLVVLLSEAKRWPDAEKELERLQEEAGEDDFIPIARRAYRGQGKALSQTRIKAVLEELKPAWARDKLQARLAEREDDLPAAKQARAEIETRGRSIQRRMTVLNVISGALLVVGLGFAVWCGRRRLEVGAVADGAVVARWSGWDGFAVLVRGEALGQVLAIGLSFAAERVLVLSGLMSFLAALPLLVLGWKYLLQPLAQTAGSAFGLPASGRAWLRAIGLGVALTGVALVGESLLSLLTNRVGFDSNWADFMPEELIWKSWFDVGLDSLNTIVCAPVCEELIYRGFLYSTLRRRFSFLPAALLSSLIFSLGHGYGLEGFLTTGWSGFVWAFSFEKTGSLVPGMISHAAGNALVSLTWLLLFRG